MSMGHDVIVIAPKDEYSPLLREEGFKYIDIDIDGKGKSIVSDLKLIGKFVSLYNQYKPDFVFHYTIKPNIYGSIACRLLSIPTIAVTTGLGYAFNKKNLFNLFIKSLYRISLLTTKEVWFLNSADKEVFLRNNIIGNRKAFVLPSEGIDSDYYAPREAAKNETFTFLLLSRLIQEKGIEEYVEASRMLKSKGVEFQSQLLGKQEKESSKSITLATVEEWQNANIIQYLGETIDVRDFIAQADCIVLPSYYMEGVPRCLMEAMSMRKPIITTDNVGCNELVVDGVNGFMCAIKDVEDLANKMEQMVNSSTQVQKTMGDKGREMILEKFDERKIIEIYIQQLQKYCTI
jgi:glycosyltransferase involved in cell wall biosynthesis